MKKQQDQKIDQVQYIPNAQKRTRKNKGEISKVSKSSHLTRRRQQLDSSEQYLLPAQIPQSSGTESIITIGKENQLNKVIIRVPFTIMIGDKLCNQNKIQIEGTQLIIKVQKQLQNVIISGKLAKLSRKMEIEEQNNEKVKQKDAEESSYSEQDDAVYPVSIWGKYVYISHYEPQNKVIKKVRKDFNTVDDGQIIKFKAKQINSDFFVILNLKAEEFVSDQFNGLVNQGNTCYMNSYLQTLYHIPAVRNLVYEAEIQAETKFPATLQQLFFNLKSSQKAVSPQTLVKSFGWGKKEASIQQDAQEFSCLFFQALQRKLNQSSPKQGYRHKKIEELFKGQLNHYILCAHVGTLPIYPTLTESLDAYTSQVHMEGDNKYRTEQYGQQQAFKGVKIAYFPPILMIQLKRFEYSFQQEKNIKILTQFQYEEQFNFSRWSTGSQNQQYQLYAVMVHQGARAESGHYYNFIKSNDKWYKFNDQIVQQVSKQKVFKYNFGGFHQSLQFDVKEMKVMKKLVESKVTAYMLVYVKKQYKDQLMIDQQNYPQWITNKQIYKSKLEEQKKNRKRFFHNVGFIDWQSQLQGKQCSDTGFLDQIILEKSKRVIEKIPKTLKISEWLIQQKIVEFPSSTQQQKKKSKKQKGATKSQQQKLSKFQLGIYVYCVNSERQMLTGFAHKPHHTMDDLLKISLDPVIIKTPFQTKKQQYLGIIKRFKVYKNQENIILDFKYQTVLPVQKEIKYFQLYQILTDKFQKKQLLQEDNGFQKLQPKTFYSYYVDDWKAGPIDILGQAGVMPLTGPSKNQLFICVVCQLPFNLTQEEINVWSFPNWYKNIKNTITLVVAEEKSPQFTELKQIHLDTTLSDLRKILFEKIIQSKCSEVQSSQNIVLKSKLKKTSKLYSQVSEPDYLTVRDITKHQYRIQYSLSSLTTSSRLSQYELQFFYRNKQFEFSEPLQIVVHKNDQNQKLVQKIKTNQNIQQYLRQDGFQPDQCHILLFSKDRTVINDVVTDEGKVCAKGQLDSVLRKEKNAVLVVQGKSFIACQKQPKVQIKQQDIEPTVHVLLHHTSQYLERVGIPRYFQVDKRIQLSQLRDKILDILGQVIVNWQGKIIVCNPFKSRIRLMTKDAKKIIELTELQQLEEIKRLKLEEKNEKKQRKKSKQILTSSRKQSLIDLTDEKPNQKQSHNPNGKINQIQDKQQKLSQILQQKFLQQNSGLNKEQIRKQIQEQIVININFPHNVLPQGDSNIKESEVHFQIIKSQITRSQKLQNNLNQDLKCDENSNHAKSQGADKEQDQNVEAVLDQQVTKIYGPETIYSIFPKSKILKIQIVHNDLIKPNIALRLNVDD